jgi:hypothetical protein
MLSLRTRGASRGALFSPVALVLLGALFPQMGQAEPALEASQSAVLSFQNHQRAVHAGTRQCAAEFEGRGGELFLFLGAIWDQASSPFALASGMVRDSARSETTSAESVPAHKDRLPFMRLFDDTDAAGRRRLCDMLVAQLKSNQLDFSEVAADDAQTLRLRFQSEVRWRHAVRNGDITVGCMKQNWNSGVRDVDVVKPACECLTESILTHLKDDQVDDWVERVARGEGAAEPWFATVQKSAEACRATR